jgi:hypothetical protein
MKATYFPLFRNTYCCKRDYTQLHPVNEQSLDTCIPASGSPEAGTGFLPQTSASAATSASLNYIPRKHENVASTKQMGRYKTE